MAAKKTKTENKENEVSTTFEVVEELPSPHRSNKRSWFNETAEKMKEDESVHGKWVKVREYDSLTALRSAASGSLRKSFGPDGFEFSTRKTDDDAGVLFAKYEPTS